MRALLRGNVLWLSLTSLLNDTASEMIFPLLPLFLVQVLGAGPAFLGLVEGVAETTASLVKLGGGWVSDRIGRRKPLAAWGYAIAAATRPIIAVAAAPWHVLAVRFTDRIGKGVRTAPRDALLAASVDDGQRATAFGVHRAADHIGAVLGPLLAACLLLLWPGRLRLVFGLATLPGVAAVLVVLLRVRETRATAPVGRRAANAPTADTPTDCTSIAGSAAGRRVAAELRRYLMVLVVFTLGNASDAFLLLRARQLGVAVSMIPILWGLLHVSKSLWSVPGGILADRFGARPTIVTGWLVYATVYAGFAFAGAAWHAWALFTVYGLFYGLTEAPEKALVARLTHGDRQGTAFGAYHFAIGLAALPASFLFGAVWAGYGATTAFLIGAGLALVAAAMLPLAVRVDAAPIVLTPGAIDASFRG